MTTARPSQDGELSWSNRLISALLAGFCGFATMFFIWFLVVQPAGSNGGDVWPPFSWNWTAGGVAAAAGFVVGPERMMDAFGTVWGAIGAIVIGEGRR